MRSTLAQQQALNELAAFLYDFLPGNPHPFADQTISFRGAAIAAGVGEYWPGGSKKPAISHLLYQTFEERPQQFCVLMLAIVRRAIGYRQGKGEPITGDAIRRLNQYLREMGFKIPELHDPKFLDRLPKPASAQKIVLSSRTRQDLAHKIVELAALAPRPRGFAFEKYLQDCFEAFRLAPRASFRLIGEQIDGSFHLQGHTYLAEATWRNERVGQEELLAFHGKVIGKAEWSRGLHISYSGYEPDGLVAFKQGKRTSIVCMDGFDLHEVLGKDLDLGAVIERKARRAAETNDAFVPVRELFG